MDKLDRKILDILQKDASLTAAEVADLYAFPIHGAAE